MRLYHTTTEAAKDAILARGFADTNGGFRIDSHRHWRGVFVADWPGNHGSQGGDPVHERAPVLVVDIPEEVIAPYEITNINPYRNWVVPAGLLNGYGPAQVIYAPPGTPAYWRDTNPRGRRLFFTAKGRYRDPWWLSEGKGAVT